MENIIEMVEEKLQNLNDLLRYKDMHIAALEKEITSLKGQIFDLKEAQK